MTFTADQIWTPQSDDSPAVVATGTATAAGALLVAIVSSNQDGATHTVTDSAGNVWVQAAESNTDRAISLCYCANAASITSVTAASSGSPTRTHIVFASWTTTGTVSLADSDAYYDSTPSNTWSPLAVTPAAAGDLLISGILFSASSRQADTASPFTVYGTMRQTLSTQAASAIAPSTSDIGATWTLTSGSNTAARFVAAAFTEASGGTEYAAAGTVAASAASTGAVTAARVVAGVVAGVVAVSGAVTATHQATGSTTSTTVVSGAVTSARPATGTSTAVAATTGAVTALHQVTGASAVVSVVSGDATVVGGAAEYPAAGTSTAASTTTGAVTVISGPVEHAAAGAVTATATTSGTVTAEYATTGTVAAVATVTGNTRLSGTKASADRTDAVPADPRAYAVAAAPRAYIVPADNRTLTA